MKIEIMTTKRKLTKNILNQIPSATLEDMKTGTLLGFILNSRENHYKVILIKNNSKYSVLPIHIWKKIDWDSSVHKNCIYRYEPKRSVYKKFESKEKRDEWFEVYRKIKILPLEQIYI